MGIHNSEFDDVLQKNPFYLNYISPVRALQSTLKDYAEDWKAYHLTGIIESCEGLFGFWGGYHIRKSAEIMAEDFRLPFFDMFHPIEPLVNIGLINQVSSISDLMILSGRKDLSALVSVISHEDTDYNHVNALCLSPDPYYAFSYFMQIITKANSFDEKLNVCKSSFIPSDKVVSAQAINHLNTLHYLGRSVY